MWQSVAVCCSMLQYVVLLSFICVTATHCCNTLLQHPAATPCCNTLLQHPAATPSIWFCLFALIHMCDMTHFIIGYPCSHTQVQGCADPQDALSYRSFFAKEPLSIGLFGEKFHIKMKHSMSFCHSVARSAIQRSWIKWHREFGWVGNDLYVPQIIRCKRQKSPNLAGLFRQRDLAN